jgi:hypothetical protein
LSGVSDAKRIQIRKKLLIKNSTQPGDYVLLLLIENEKANKKAILAAQALDFKVLASK